MSCLHLYDFISGTRIALAAPPCQADGDGGEFFDIVRPSAQTREMVEQHLSALAAAYAHDGKAGEA